jgi:hypothetical protein
LAIGGALLVAGGWWIVEPGAKQEPSTLDLTQPQPPVRRRYAARIELRPLNWAFDPLSTGKSRSLASLPPGSVPESSKPDPRPLDSVHSESLRPWVSSGVPVRRVRPESASRNWLLPPPPDGQESLSGDAAPQRWKEGFRSPDDAAFSEPAPLPDVAGWPPDPVPSPSLAPPPSQTDDGPLDDLSEQALEHEVENELRRRLDAPDLQLEPTLPGTVSGAADPLTTGLPPILGYAGPEVGDTATARAPGMLSAALAAGGASASPGTAFSTDASSGRALQSVTQSDSPSGDPATRTSALPRIVGEDSWRHVFRGLADSLDASAGWSRAQPSGQNSVPASSVLNWHPPPDRESARGLAFDLSRSDVFPSPEGPVTGFAGAGDSAAEPNRETGASPSGWTTLDMVDASPEWRAEISSGWIPLSDAAERATPSFGEPRRPASIDRGLDPIRLPDLQPDKTVNLDLDPRTLRTLMR